MWKILQQTWYLWVRFDLIGFCFVLMFTPYSVPEAAVSSQTINSGSGSPSDPTYGPPAEVEYPEYKGEKGEMILEHVPQNRDASPVLILVHGQHSQDQSTLNDNPSISDLPISKERWVNLLDALRDIKQNEETVYDRFEIWRYVYDNRNLTLKQCGESLGYLIAAANTHIIPDNHKALIQFHCNPEIRSLCEPSSFNLSGRPIVLLAHSYGGLVARSFMSQTFDFGGGLRTQRGAEIVRRLITLATPHLGSPGADILLQSDFYGNRVGKLLLDQPIPLPGGELIPIGEIVSLWEFGYYTPLIDLMEYKGGFSVNKSHRYLQWDYATAKMDETNRPHLPYSFLDGYDPIDEYSKELNELSNLNQAQIYETTSDRFIFYHGGIDPNAGIIDLLVVLFDAIGDYVVGIAEKYNIGIEKIVERKKVRAHKESSGLDVVSTIMASIEPRLFEDNDGFVPLQSAVFGTETYKQIRDFSYHQYPHVGGYDHREMVEGKSPDDGNLFPQIFRDLMETLEAVPIPSITAGNSSMQLGTGEEAVINLTVSNTGEAADITYVDVSVSDNIEILAGIPQSKWTEYDPDEPGRLIFQKGDQGTPTLKPQFVLYELIEHSFGRESRKYQVRIRKTDNEIGWLKYRVSMLPVGFTELGPNFKRDPLSGEPDQQGWHSKKITIFSSELPEPDGPVVESINPLPGTGSVNVRPIIKITFSRPMNPDTTIPAFTITPEIERDLTLNQNVLTVRPNEDLQYGTPYTVTIAKSATDLDGRSMAKSFFSNFTTEAEPTFGPVIIEEIWLEDASSGEQLTSSKETQEETVVDVGTTIRISARAKNQTRDEVSRLTFVFRVDIYDENNERIKDKRIDTVDVTHIKPGTTGTTNTQYIITDQGRHEFSVTVRDNKKIVTVVTPGVPPPPGPFFDDTLLIHAGPTNEDSRAAAWGDYDNDGWIDLCVRNSLQLNHIYRNLNGAGFEEIPVPALQNGVPSEGCTWVDYDNDGFLDLYVVNHGVPNQLLRNINGLSFQAVPEAGVDDSGRGIAGVWADFDLDGNLDLYVTNLDEANRLYQNLGDGTFAEVVVPPSMADSQSKSYGAAWADFDRDGDTDLYVANYGQEDRLYVNQDNGNFEEMGGPAGIALDRGALRSYAGIWGDYNNDGWLDLYVIREKQHNTLFRNNGDETFSLGAEGASLEDGGKGVGATWLDYNNDGWLDLYLVNEGTPDKLFINNNGSFIDITPIEIAKSTLTSNVAAGDYDNDGWSDLYLTSSNNNPNYLFRNKREFDNDWLQLKLIGIASNTMGVGAQITARAGLLEMSREVTCGAGWGAQNSTTVELGLGLNNSADIEIRWPSGIIQHLQVTANQKMIVEEQTVPPDADFDYTVEVDRTVRFTDLSTDNPNSWKWNFGDLTSNAGQSQQNPTHTYAFDGTYDVTLQAANPYGSDSITRPVHISVNGVFRDVTSQLFSQPFIENSRAAAWGDYDEDGLLDLFVVNSGDNGGQNHLYHNVNGMVFEAVEELLLPGAQEKWQSQGCTWVDYDNDGDLDLYVVNQNIPNQLFRNVVGSFELVDAGIGNSGVGVAAAWADYDKDGYLDLYLANAGGPNRLFHNNGNDTFSDVTAQAGDGVGDDGNGTAAAWADYDNDGNIDLYVVNYNRENRLLKNNGDSTFSDVTFQAGGGLEDGTAGNAIAWGDYDNDGDLDLYLANDNGSDRLFVNSGNGTFSNILEQAEEDWRRGFGVIWLDYNNDGWLDLYVANDGDPDKLYTNVNGAFTEPPMEMHNTSTGNVVAGDYDNDGWVDVYLPNSNNNANRLLRKPREANRWLHLELEGTTSNRMGIGARVIVKAGTLLMVREVRCGGQDSPTLEFGVGLNSRADIEIRWPSGITQVLTVAADKKFTILEPPPHIKVFPGDTNNDGIVDEKDILPIGVHWHKTGSPRLPQSIEWKAWTVLPWEPPAATYADANGDGIVNEKDVLPIGVNWGKGPTASPPIAMHDANLLPSRVKLPKEALLAHEPHYREMLKVLGNDFPQVREALMDLLTLAREYAVPDHTALLPNFPNPFNPETWIPFQLAESSPVTIQIFDISGNRVRRLDLGYQEAGSYTIRQRAGHWDGRSDTGEQVASGLYIYHLQAGDHRFSRKMVILK